MQCHCTNPKSNTKGLFRCLQGGDYRVEAYSRCTPSHDRVGGRRDLEKDSGEAKQKKAVEVVSLTLSESSFEYDDVFDVDYSIP